MHIWPRLKGKYQVILTQFPKLFEFSFKEIWETCIPLTWGNAFFLHFSGILKASVILNVYYLVLNTLFVTNFPEKKIYIFVDSNTFILLLKLPILVAKEKDFMSFIMIFLFEHFFFDSLFSHSLQTKALAINLSRQNIWMSGITSINIGHYLETEKCVLGYLYHCIFHINYILISAGRNTYTLWDRIIRQIFPSASKQKLKIDQ